MKVTAIRIALLSVAVLASLIGTAWAEQYIFLNDGRVLQAERSEIVGDTLRIQTPTGAVVDIPRADVTTIHEPPLPGGAPPGASAPQGPPPASVYGNMTQQMNEEVRRQIQQGRGTPAHP